MSTPSSSRSSDLNRRFVVGITGASGAPYALRVIEGLANAGCEVHVSVSRLGRRLLAEEADVTRLDPDALSGGQGDRVIIHNDADVGSTIASGSFRHGGMAIVPASSNTVGAVAAGITESLVQRAAMVTLKERRRLVIAHREMPLSLIDLRNMQRLAEAGAIIAPCNPGFYLRPTSVADMVDFVAGRILDLLGVNHDWDTRWDPREARNRRSAAGDADASSPAP